MNKLILLLSLIFAIGVVFARTTKEDGDYKTVIQLISPAQIISDGEQFLAFDDSKTVMICEKFNKDIEEYELQYNLGPMDSFYEYPITIWDYKIKLVQYKGLCAISTIYIVEKLTPDQIRDISEILTSFFEGQYCDGWGEGVAQRELYLPGENTAYYVSLYCNKESIHLINK